MTETLKAILRSRLPADISSIDEQTILFSSGLLDSLSLIDIVQEIEKTFSITVHWSELNLENFDSLDKIIQYVVGKKNGS